MSVQTPLGALLSRDDLLAALRELPMDARVKVCRLLADGVTAKAVSAVGDEAVFEMTRVESYEVVAARLGVSVAAVNRAVTAHRRRVRGQVAA
jgi:hypothetical protein